MAGLLNGRCAWAVIRERPRCPATACRLGCYVEGRYQAGLGLELIVRPRAILLFDLGGVLFCDPWETLLLTPARGLAARLGLPVADVARAARDLWQSYSVRQSEEQQYWHELGKAIGQVFPESLVRDVERELWLPNPRAPQLIASGASTGAALGVASNNTSFWYAKQREILKIDEWAEPDLIFVSHELGVTKSTPGKGLFEIIIEFLPAPTVTLVEDQSQNLSRAGRLGMHTIFYRFSKSCDDLPDFPGAIGSAR